MTKKMTFKKKNEMIINKEHAIKFLVAMGFAKAVNWEDSVLTTRLGQVPNKIDMADVGEEFEDLYQELANSDPDEAITFEGAKKSKKKKVPPAKKKAEQQELELGDAPSKEVKPAKAGKKNGPPAKKAKPAKDKGEVVEHDAFGSRVGTISARVNGAVTNEWKEGKDIAKELKISFTQARARLYHANQEGIVECRRLVQYRLSGGNKK